MGTREKIKTVVARFSTASPTPSWAFFIVCVSTLLGLAVGLFIAGFTLLIYCVAWVSTVGFVSTVYRRPQLALLCALLAAASFGFVRASVARQTAHPLSHLVNSETHVVSGLVQASVEEQRRSVRFSVATFSVDGTQQAEKLSVVAEVYPKVRAGDVVELRCRFTAEAAGRRPAAPVCLFPDVDIVRHEPVGWAGILPAARNSVAEKIDVAFPEPAAGFIHGLLLGGSAKLTERLREALTVTGTVHIVALSGFNITIIATFLLFLLRFIGMPRRLQVMVVGLTLTAFVIAVGGQASLIRAAIMGMLVVVAHALGREATVRNSIVLAAVVMVMVDPFILTDDVGFQLSFLATIGIVIFYPRLEVYASRIPKLFGVREALLLTIAAQLLVVPVVVLYFGRLSFIAPLVNAIVVPVIPFIMLFGALGAVGAFVAAPVGQLLGLPAWMAAQFVLWVIQTTARLPYASALVSTALIIPVIIVAFAICLYLLRPAPLVAEKRTL